jgi:hypothetical protein
MKTRFPEFKRIIAYNNKQLQEELLPIYRQMIEHFSANLWLAEPSTRSFFGELVKFVEMWDRHLAGSVPFEVLLEYTADESRLLPFYDDLAAQMGCLRQKLAE